MLTANNVMIHGYLAMMFINRTYIVPYISNISFSVIVIYMMINISSICDIVKSSVCNYYLHNHLSCYLCNFHNNYCYHNFGFYSSLGNSFQFDFNLEILSSAIWSKLGHFSSSETSLTGGISIFKLASQTLLHILLSC